MFLNKDNYIHIHLESMYHLLLNHPISSTSITNYF